MSGFMSGTTALSLYKIDDPAAVTTDKIKQYAFRPIDNIGSEAKAWGWTSIEDMLDTAWERSIPEKGEFLCFALRVDTRKVPGPVLRKYLALAIRQEQERRREEGDAGPISKARKKELKEQVSARRRAYAAENTLKEMTMRNMRNILCFFLLCCITFSVPGVLAGDATSFDPTRYPVKPTSSGGVPVGSIVAWPVSKNPQDMDKWLECNGQTISAAVYPELVAFVGGRV